MDLRKARHEPPRFPLGAENPDDQGGMLPQLATGLLFAVAFALVLLTLQGIESALEQVRPGSAAHAAPSAADRPSPSTSGKAIPTQPGD